MEEATRAESSDSMAASAAIVPAAGSSPPMAPRSMAGTEGSGSERGISPMLARGLGTSAARTVTMTMPTSEPGIEEWIFGAKIMHTATIATAASE